MTAETREKEGSRERKRGGGREKARKKKESSHSFHWPLVLCWKSDLDQQWEFWRSFLSPLPLHSFLWLGTTSLSPSKKHSPEFFREILEDASTCADQVERKNQKPVSWGQDQRCWHQGPKYALNKQYLFIPLFLTFCSSKWSSSPPRQNSFIQGS